MVKVLIVSLFLLRILVALAFPLPRWQLVARHVVSSIIATVVIASPCLAINEWQLLNGNVQLPETIVLQTKDRGSLTLSGPTLIGTGGGGAVFAFDDSFTLLKISWKESSKSVQRECRTLQMLQEANVEYTERCQGEFDYKEGDGRVMIAVEPYVRDSVARVEQVDLTKQSVAVEQIARTVVQMLAADIVTIDVQPLINSKTGDVLFIDLTEAQKLQPPYTFLDKALMSSFTNEMLALVPDRYVKEATSVMKKELERLESSRYLTLSDEAQEVLNSQTLFFPDEEIVGKSKKDATH